MKITMTLLVRNEEDLLEENVWYHSSQGVDSFIIMDNLSEDRTPDIIRSLARELEIEHLTQDEDTYSQPEWLTEMAKLAARAHRASWIIHNDADEFWQAQNGTVRDFLSSVAPEVGVVKVRRHNAVLTHGRGHPLLSTSHPRTSTLFEAQSLNNHNLPIPPKCAHRASEKAYIFPGNHDVGGIEGETVTVSEGLRILHYPFRSLQNYKRKILVGGRAYAQNSKLSPEVGATWRQHHKSLEKEGLERFWMETSRSSSDILLGKLDHRIFEDDSIARLLKQRADTALSNNLESALADLVDGTQSNVEDFVSTQTRLLAEIPDETRRSRPLYYNLQFCVTGPARQLEAVRSLKLEDLRHAAAWDFSALRDAYSLFPQNEKVTDFAAALLAAHCPDDVYRLRSDCSGRKVILHITCESRLHLARSSVESFAALDQSYHHVVLVGDMVETSENETRLSLRYDGEILRVPVPDSYENLHRKMFYALMLIDLVSEATMVIKIDDNLHLGDGPRFLNTVDALLLNRVEYAGRLVGTDRHQSQWHGWHVSKCSDPVIEARGYQYPLPREYASGGYGYVLGKRGIKACAYMYLAMKEFFGLRSVGLEDAYVGHAMYAQNIELHDTSSDANLLALPGLVSLESGRALNLIDL